MAVHVLLEGAVAEPKPGRKERLIVPVGSIAPEENVPKRKSVLPLIE